MGITQNGPKPLGRTVLVLELCEYTTGGEQRFSIVASVPGRDGTYVQHWQAHNGAVDDATATDILARVDRWVIDAFFSLGGIQTAFTER